MKIINKVLVIAIIVVIAASCKKDETKVVLKSGVAPTLAASAPTVVLSQATADDEAVTFTWGQVDYGFDAALSYVLQITKAGSGFASAVTSEVSVNYADFKKTFTHKDLNKELLKILPAGTAAPIEVRLKSNVGNIVSNAVSLTVTPYRDLVLYSWPQAINVAGNYQGWSPGTAPQIVDKFTAGPGKNYDGYINFTDPSPEFKFVKGNDWPFGDFGDAGPNKLGNGGPNLKLPSAGIYRISANAVDLTWSATRIDTWGIIGSATPKGWDASTAMTYDPVSKTYSITTDLVAGELKFRANNDWGINFGDNKSNGGPDNYPDYNGDNIAIAEGGNYTITLDLSVAGNYHYTIKKN